MRYSARATVCVSSQAGCAMGCTFCATGQAGFERHLSAGEIVEQVLRAQHASPQRVSNVVFMGMGEPLANPDAVLDACTRLHDDVGISARHLTVSTVGVVPGIERLTEFELPVTLAVSLHAPDDALREQLVPLNRRYPLAAVLDAARAYADRKGRRVSFEYACISGVNDLPHHADALAGRLTGFRGGAHVNLIPLNDTAGYPGRPSEPDRIAAFAERLRAAGVQATVRRNRGTDDRRRVRSAAFAKPPESARADASRLHAIRHNGGVNDTPVGQPAPAPDALHGRHPLLHPGVLHAPLVRPTSGRSGSSSSSASSAAASGSRTRRSGATLSRSPRRSCRSCSFIAYGGLSALGNVSAC